MQVAHDLPESVKTVLKKGVFNVTNQSHKDALKKIVREILAAVIDNTAVTDSEMLSNQEELFNLLNDFETAVPNADEDEAAKPPGRKTQEGLGRSAGKEGDKPTGVQSPNQRPD